MNVPSTACPCGSGRLLAACCGPYIDGRAAAPTAEALMRSRYTAYVLGDADYLLRTWHPDTRPVSLDLQADAVRWVGLKVGECTDGGEEDDTGYVSFVARYKEGGRATRLAERSRFLRVDGRWLYVDGELEAAPPPTPARNALCPCGSGKKYKRCCGA